MAKAQGDIVCFICDQAPCVCNQAKKKAPTRKPRKTAVPEGAASIRAPIATIKLGGEHLQEKAKTPAPDAIHDAMRTGATDSPPAMRARVDNPPWHAGPPHGVVSSLGGDNPTARQSKRAPPSNRVSEVDAAINSAIRALFNAGLLGEGTIEQYKVILTSIPSDEEVRAAIRYRLKHSGQDRTTEGN